MKYNKDRYVKRIEPRVRGERKRDVSYSIHPIGVYMSRLTVSDGVK